MRHLAIAILMSSLVACSRAPSDRSEGMYPDDCSDGADNDSDGVFDCDDPGCFGAPVCSGPRVDGGNADANSDGGVSMTLTYLISSLSIPVASGGVAAGYDLDGIDSGAGSTAPDADCQEFAADYRSLRDPGLVGVDNAYQSLVPTIESIMDPADCPGGVTTGCVDALLQEGINGGNNLLLIEVSGLESFDDDPSVEVTVFEGTGVPTLSGGSPAPDQTFGTGTMLARATGEIGGGRLRVVLPRLPFSGFLAAGLQRVELRADVSATGLSNGQYGGSLSVDEIVADAERESPGIGPTVRSIMEPIADIDPGVDPTICRSLSMGATFNAVPASRAP